MRPRRNRSARRAQPRRRRPVLPLTIVGVAIVLAALVVASRPWAVRPALEPMPHPARLADAQTALRTGIALGREHRNLEAIPYFRRVLELRPGEWDSHSNLSSALGNSA